MFLIRRGIEAVITGLTRNQFVDNTTRGFESLPLRQRCSCTIRCDCIFLLTQSVGHEHCTARCEGSHIPRSREELAHLRRVWISSRSEYPSHRLIGRSSHENYLTIRLQEPHRLPLHCRAYCWHQGGCKYLR